MTINENERTSTKTYQDRCGSCQGVQKTLQELKIMILTLKKTKTQNKKTKNILPGNPITEIFSFFNHKPSIRLLSETNHCVVSCVNLNRRLVKTCAPCGSISVDVRLILICAFTCEHSRPRVSMVATWPSKVAFCKYGVSNWWRKLGLEYLQDLQHYLSLTDLCSA